MKRSKEGKKGRERKKEKDKRDKDKERRWKEGGKKERKGRKKALWYIFRPYTPHQLSLNISLSLRSPVF